MLQETQPEWQEIDHALRTIARRRAALDAEEARWLREAERCQIWRELGMVSAIDYLERVLGYSPRVAHERMRVARVLGELPVLTGALACGELPYSAVRELTRIAMPGTEGAWCEAAKGKNLRQIEELVTGRHRGDRPEDPADPDVPTRVVRFELSAETFALLRQAHQFLDEERGSRLSDDEVVAALCDAVLDRGNVGEPSGRAKFQIALTVCERCAQGWQQGAGAKVAVRASTVERARCDAQEIGSIDGPEPGRAHQDVTPSVVRLVWRRDGGRCRVPGCRSSRGLEVHHLVHREHGGGHEASNLILLCSACHSAHHRGKLRIRGTAERLEVERGDERAHVGAEAERGDEHARVSAEVERGDEHARVSAEVERGDEHARVSSEVERGDEHAHVGVEVERGDERERVGAEVDRGDERAHVGAEVERAHVDAEVKRGDERVHVGAEVERGDERAHVGAEVKRGDERARVDAEVERGNERAHVGANDRGCRARGAGGRLSAAIVCTQAKQALIGLGWPSRVAAAAVASATSALGEQARLEPLIFEALRRCAKAA